MDKNLFEYFPEYSEEEVLNAVKKLTIINQEILYEAFGQTLKEIPNKDKLDKRKKEILETTINKTLARYLKKDKKREKAGTYLTDDIIRDTFSKIEYKQLSKEQEKRWIKKLKLAFYYEVDRETRKKYFDYYCEVKPGFKKKYDKAKKNEKKELLKEAIKDANEEKKKFILNNERLILSNIHVYNTTIPKEELMQEANIGIITALKKFNVDTEYKFSTYAIWWIRQRIYKYSRNNEGTIRIPSNTFIKQSKILKARENLIKILHRNPTIEEIAEETGIPAKKVNELIKIMAFQRSILSLDEPIKNEDNEKENRENFVVDPKIAFTDEIENKMLIEQVKKIIKQFDPRTQMIIYMRMGLYDGEFHTLDYIAKKYNLTRERIRQIELTTLQTIKFEMEKIKEKPKRKQQKINKTPKKEEIEYELISLILLEITLFNETTRQILELKYKYKLTNEEICSKLEISETELISKEKKAYLILRKKIKEQEHKTRKKS